MSSDDWLVLMRNILASKLTTYKGVYYLYVPTTCCGLCTSYTHALQIKYVYSSVMYGSQERLNTYTVYALMCQFCVSNICRDGGVE